jgi:hypothetical protein
MSDSAHTAATVAATYSAPNLAKRSRCSTMIVVAVGSRRSPKSFRRLLLRLGRLRWPPGRPSIWRSPDTSSTMMSPPTCWAGYRQLSLSGPLVGGLGVGVLGLCPPSQVRCSEEECVELGSVCVLGLACWPQDISVRLGRWAIWCREPKNSVVLGVVSGRG